MQVQAPGIAIAGPLRPHATPVDLIQATATLSFVTDAESIYLDPARDRRIFQVHGFGYSLELVVRNGCVILRRNGAEVSVLVPRDADRILVFAEWSPEKIGLSADPLSGSVDAPKFTRRVTPPAVPPIELVVWAREQSVVGRTVYSSANELAESTIGALQSVENLIDTTGLHHPFWDVQRGASGGPSRVPKREPDVQPTLHGFLHDVALRLGLTLLREHRTGVGSLDFLVLAPLSSGKQGRVAIEMKHAHNRLLRHGLQKQLPEYMRTTGADFGIYLVNWFRGADFDEPRRYENATGLEIELLADRMGTGLSKRIRVMTLDLTRRMPPSRLT